MTPEPAGGSPPLDRFLERWWGDRDQGRVLPLEEYLALFPGDSENIAREYLALKGLWDEATGAGAPSQQRIGHYRIIRELGGGGQGVVYLARDQRLQRDVAIKKLRNRGVSIDTIERFRREAKIASQLDHPGICPVYDIGDDGGEPFIVMRYVEGTTLAARIDTLRSTDATAFRFVALPGAEDDAADEAEDPPEETAKEHGPPSRVPRRGEIAGILRLVEQIARALHEAHEAGIVHRDVKPANVVVAADGQPVLLDFGLATMTGGDMTSVTATGQTPGTPPYMSPEQMAGKIRLDRRSDVYSLGVTLFECLTLTRPFDRSSQMARQVLFVDAPDPQTLNPAVSKDLKTVIRTALEKDRERRYRTAADFADDLRAVREHQPIKARPVGPLGHLVRFAQRNPVVAASLFTVLAVLTGALIVTSFQRNELRRALSLSKPLADAQEIVRLRSWSERLWPAHANLLGGDEGIDAWLAKAGDVLGRKTFHDDALRVLKAGEGSYTADERSARVRALEELTKELAAFPDEVAAMQKRRSAAATLERRTIEEPRAEWERVAASLAKDPAFGSVTPFRPQLGLIPIGRSPEGFEEFVVADSGDAPKRDQAGALQMTESSGLVLVLLPGGPLRFARRPPSSNQRSAGEGETFIPPFFLGKHEVAQSQWKRIMGDNPAHARPGSLSVPTTLLHPIEFVSWVHAAEFARRLDLDLQTADQWELGARAAHHRRWGDCADIDCLEGRENFADLEYAKINPDAPHVPWDDRFRFSAPIDALQPNSFGLHHMLANVQEWCREHYQHLRVPSTDAIENPPLGPDGQPERRIMVRGSSFFGVPGQADCSWFGANMALGVQPLLGVRVSRPAGR